MLFFSFSLSKAVLSDRRECFSLMSQTNRQLTANDLRRYLNTYQKYRFKPFFCGWIKLDFVCVFLLLLLFHYVSFCCFLNLLLLVTAIMLFFCSSRVNCEHEYFFLFSYIFANLIIEYFALFCFRLLLRVNIVVMILSF